MKKIVAVFLGLALFIPVSTQSSTLTGEITANKNRVNVALSRSFTLTYGNSKFEVAPVELRKWIKIREGSGSFYIKLAPGRIYSYLNKKISPVVNDTGSNTRFVKQDGQWRYKAKGRNGKIVDGAKTSLRIRSAVRDGKSSAELAMKTYRPPVLTMREFEKLGINTLLGRGVSDFSGSPASRIHNIAVGRLRFQGVLVAPGEEFSFNDQLGLVSPATGYLPELVIKENVTTPEYGGGLCQVSTTAFRAALQSGMDVTERRPHAYPVQYYGPPGYDATIYPPHPDLKFRNISGGWALIQTSIQGNKLIFDVYGKENNRTVKLDGPHVSARRADGSVRALLRQLVTDKAGQVVHNEMFKSEYKSPALFPSVRAANNET